MKYNSQEFNTNETVFVVLKLMVLLLVFRPKLTNIAIFTDFMYKTTIGFASFNFPQVIWLFDSFYELDLIFIRSSLMLYTTLAFHTIRIEPNNMIQKLHFSSDSCVYWDIDSLCGFLDASNMTPY